VLVRFGGEEFILLSVGVEAAAIQHLLQQFIQDVELKSVQLGAQQSQYTVSIGWLCAIPQRGQTTAHWLAQADVALYQAKANGRNGAVQAQAVA